MYHAPFLVLSSAKMSNRVTGLNLWVFAHERENWFWQFPPRKTQNPLLIVQGSAGGRVERKEMQHRGWWNRREIANIEKTLRKKYRIQLTMNLEQYWETSRANNPDLGNATPILNYYGFKDVHQNLFTAPQFKCYPLSNNIAYCHHVGPLIEIIPLFPKAAGDNYFKLLNKNAVAWLSKTN